MALIGIIIPCYYDSDVIRPCLESIAVQKAKNEIRVYLVNDCSPNTDCEYSDLIDEYKTKIDLKYFKTKTNVGPGGARQLGLENIDEDIQYIMFIDDDDELDNPDSIQSYVDILYNSSENIGFLTG
jgi:glycosyltransferase involved in cell wall biosynthesis